MKKAQREIYQGLANEVDFALCSFCKYAECYGSACCGDVEVECHHTLRQVNEDEYERASQLGDCWGFRPSHPVSFIADIIGIMLTKGWTSATWWQNKKGIWKVFGVGL